MNVTVYFPAAPAYELTTAEKVGMAIQTDGNGWPAPNAETEAVAAALVEIHAGIANAPIDVIFQNANVVVFCIFDYQGPRNEAAEIFCEQASGCPFGMDEDTFLRGPVVVFSL